MKKNTLIILAVLVALGGGVALLTTNKGDAPKNSVASSVQTPSVNTPIVKTQAQEPTKTGSSGYISYADYTANKDTYKDAHVVLYFHAPWCPTCQALDKNITANLGNLPANTVIVKTDYDSSRELKQKYGVTYQHTLVQVDASGNKIKKWSGSPELKDVIDEIQT